MDVHDTIGFDLVGMVVDDLVVCGAEPLFMTDYIACGRVVPERIAAIVKGIAEACVEAGCALVGGETAEHPGLMEPDAYDVAGAATGVVEATDLLGPGRVRPGDVVVAMASSGLHSNGYSLVRHVLLEQAGWALDRDVAELGRTLGEELLEPTRIYAKACLALARRPVSTRWRTSPAAASRPTSRGCCPRSCRRPSTAAPGRRRPSSTSYDGWARCPRKTSRRRSTAASAWSPCCRPATSTGRGDARPVRRARLGRRRGGARRRPRRRGPAHRPVRRLEPPRGPHGPFRAVPDRFSRNFVHFGMGVCGNSHPLGSVAPTTT